MSAATHAIYAAALQHHRSGRHAEAISFYQRTLSQMPQHRDAMFNMAALLAQSGQVDQAIVHYHRVLELQPEDPDTLSNLGNLEFGRGRIGEAEALYRRALAVNPEYIAARTNLANACMRQNKLADAVGEFERVLALEPKQTTARNGLGTALWNLGRRAEARRCFEQLLKQDANNPDAVINLGNVLLELGEVAKAEPHLLKALRLKPDWPQAHYNVALLRLKQKQRAAGMRHLRIALRRQPNYPEATRALADLLQQRRKSALALALLQAALEQNPADAQTVFQIGNIHFAERRPAEALRHYRRAAEIKPDSHELQANLGTVLNALGQAEASAAAQRQAIALNPKFALAWNGLGNAMSSLERIEEARAAYQQAVDIEPDLVIARVNLGNALRLLGRYHEAERELTRGIEIEPGNELAHNNWGLLLQVQNRHEEAIEAFKRSIECRPGYLEALNNLAISYQLQGAFGNAIKLYRDVIAMEPQQYAAYFNLGGILQLIGRYDESVTIYRQLLQLCPSYVTAYAYLAHGMLQQCNWANLDAVTSRMEEHIKDSLRTGRRVAAPGFGLMSTPIPMALRFGVAKQAAAQIKLNVADTRAALQFQHRKPVGGKIRVGYVSPDFRHHSIAVAFRGLLDAHDRSRFELCGYSLAPLKHDDFTEHFRKRFDVFRDISALPFRAAAEQIHGDGVHILIDLAGYTRFSRLEVFALQPAPIQAHYLGYSSTIGGDFLQYLITDHWQIAPGAEQYFAEKLVYLPDTFMTTTRDPYPEAMPSRAEHGLPDRGIVFCNFNAHYKIEPKLWGIWMRLLKRIPGSVLWLLKGTPSTERNLRAEAANRGIDPDRLIFATKVPRPDHLSRQRLADLALDTLYHGGGVTTTDALWVGVPMVTVAGESPPSRNGATLLAAVGLEDLICSSMDAYERAAFELATQPERLAALKARLAANVKTHPLFDTERLTRHLEAAYRNMFQRWIDGLEPEAIEVPALPRSTEKRRSAAD